MRKTSLPTALVYGWNRYGRYELVSDIYWEENLYEKVVIHSYRNANKVKQHLAKNKPDIILVFGEIPQELSDLQNRNVISTKIVQRDEIFEDNIIANVIVCQSTFWSCK